MLVGVQPLRLALQVGDFVPQAVDQAAFEIGADNVRMDIALAADAGRIAQPLRDALDGGDDIFLRLTLAVGGFEGLQGRGRQHGAGPGAKVLGGEGLAGDIAQVAVDVAGAQLTHMTIGVDIFEQLLPFDVGAGAHHAGDAAVAELQVPFLAGLALEAETDGVAADGDVLVAQGRQAIGVVGAGIFVITDADQRLFQQGDNAG